MLYNNRASAEYKLNKYQDAKNDCDKAITLNPNYGYAYLNRGIAEEMLRMASDACNDWRKAVSLGVTAATELSHKIANNKFEHDYHEKIYSFHLYLLQ